MTPSETGTDLLAGLCDDSDTEGQIDQRAPTAAGENTKVFDTAQVVHSQQKLVP